MFTVSRREFIKSAASAAAISTGTSFGIGGACAAESIVATEWGGATIEAMQKIAAKQSSIQVNWQVYSPSVTIVLAKMKATWPHPGIDLLAGWDGTFHQVADEGWAEPVTVEKVPNLADVSEKFLIKDSAGNITNIPYDVSAMNWSYREDITPFRIVSIDDLLDPRLKGKICFPSTTANFGAQLVSIALYKGGNEKNMDPAWDFMKKLAKSGNIGRVASGDVEVTNSVSSGETSVTFTSFANLVNLQSKLPLRLLTKMDLKTGFLTFFYCSGWNVVKGGNTAAAFQFANFTISPENNSLYSSVTGNIPANMKATVSDKAKPFAFNKEEMDQCTYVPDWSYLQKQSDGWRKRWEQEIAPLL